jgi:type IV pilus assembly protein PilW
MSLVEILVGVLIGLIGIVVIFQVLAVAETRKRTTVHGGDAQSAGSIALYTMQRDVQHAGYGFGGAEPAQLGCEVQASDKGDTTPVPPIPPRPNFKFRLYPIEIVQGEDIPAKGAGAPGSPDRINVLWGNSNQVVSPQDWKASADASSGGVKMITITRGRAGLEYGDVLLLTSVPDVSKPSTECALVQVTDRPADPADPTVPLKVVGFDSDYTLNAGEKLSAQATPSPRFNKDVAWPASVFAPITQAGFLFNLGKQPRRAEWRITLPGEANPNRLVMNETLFGGVTPVEAADGMINLQAEYGIDLDDDHVISEKEWSVVAPDNSTALGDYGRPCLNSPAKSWRCVLAIRVALLARSAHWDKGACSPNPQWTSGTSGALVATNFVMTNVDGTAPTAADLACLDDPPSPNNWRRYRYSVYETVVPLRNMIWGTAP